MTKTLICALLGLSLAAPALRAQTAPAPSAREARAAASFNAQMFYQLLVGEMSAATGDVGSAVALMLDAARKTGDAQIFKRATDLALGARAGDSALQAARSWRQAHPRSVEANRYVLQILLGLNRVAESTESLKALVELTPEAERAGLLQALPALYGRASDKKLASTVVEQALAGLLADSRSAAPAWTAVARLRAAAADVPAALDALTRAQLAQAHYVPAALVAVELMDKGRPQAELRVRKYLDSATSVDPLVRLAYARSLADLQRLRDAQTQLELLTSAQPDVADGWLLLGSVQMDSARPSDAEASFKRYLALDTPQGATSRGRAQAHLMLAQLAEKKGDLADAERWLDKVSGTELLMQTQSRRATLMARQGKMAEARALIRKLPERDSGDARAKLLAEVGLLREFKEYQEAHALLAKAASASPQDADLVYEQAMMAEKLGRLDEMEQLLRRIMAAKPDYHAAYNALGYSLADRGLRLAEAKQLIQKALEFAPNDPYIQDSLAWVEFRLGNRQEALRVIETAYKAKPDAEIAAHFGEILWSLGQRERAQLIWREGLQINADNETLQETLRRLQVKP
jgi:tetratricopeptide (TPR) repeat protein